MSRKQTVTEYVCGFLFAGDRLNRSGGIGNKVVLILKARPAWQAGQLNGVGGKMRSGETPRDAMAREFKEETGVRTKADGWEHKVTLRGPDWAVHFLAAWMSDPLSAFSFCPLELKGKADEPVAWFDVNHFPLYVLPNVRWLVPLCMDGDLAFPIDIGDVTKPDQKPGRRPGFAAK